MLHGILAAGTDIGVYNFANNLLGKRYANVAVRGVCVQDPWIGNSPCQFLALRVVDVVLPWFCTVPLTIEFV